MSHIFRIGDRVRGKWLTGPDAEVVIHSFQITPRGTIVKGEIMLIDGDCIVMQRNGRLAVSHTDYLEPILPKLTGLESYDTTATDEATKAMLKAMSEKGVACV